MFMLFYVLLTRFTPQIYVYLAYTRVSQKKETILNGHNIFNIHGGEMKQKLAES